jgi:hypothetical protein
MSTAQAIAAAEIKPEFASMAVVWVPESARGPAANDEAIGIDEAKAIEVWARRSSLSNGFGAPEAAAPVLPTDELRPQESLFATLCRLASGLAK